MGFYKNTNSGYEQYLEKVYKSTIESLNPMCDKIMTGYRNKTDRWMIIPYISDNNFVECYHIVKEYTKVLDIKICCNYGSRVNGYIFIEFDDINERDKVYYWLKKGLDELRERR